MLPSSIELPFVSQLLHRLRQSEPLVQVVLGPRQVGKTTGIRMLLEQFEEPSHYVSADGLLARSGSWLVEQWAIARTQSPNCLLVIDEVQKIERWSEGLKQLWDAPQRGPRMRVVVLGSSSLEIQTGLNESLAGRFQLHRVFPWNFEESRRAYGISFEAYLRTGGYPGSYRFVDTHNQAPSEEWLGYVKESIVDAVIGRDILSQSRVKSPALFRQAFDIACAYGAQEISYTKLLGQLQDRGNTDLIRHYLDLFEGAFLLRQLHKYSNKPVLRKTSSPKILPACPALYSIILDGDLDTKERGRAFEIAVGNAIARKPGKLYYWRHRNDEVDYVYQFGKRLVAIEVKSGAKQQAKGLARFKQQFSHAELRVVTPENYEQVIETL